MAIELIFTLAGHVCPGTPKEDLMTSPEVVQNLYHTHEEVGQMAYLPQSRIVEVCTHNVFETAMGTTNDVVPHIKANVSELEGDRYAAMDAGLDHDSYDEDERAHEAYLNASSDDEAVECEPHEFFLKSQTMRPVKHGTDMNRRRTEECFCEGSRSWKASRRNQYREVRGTNAVPVPVYVSASDMLGDEILESTVVREQIEKPKPGDTGWAHTEVFTPEVLVETTAVLYLEDRAANDAELLGELVAMREAGTPILALQEPIRNLI